MAQDDSSKIFNSLPPVRAVNALADLGGKIQGAVEPMLPKGWGVMRKPDTGWHDTMVKTASDSFRKLTPEGPKLGSKKKTTKKTQKTPARKKD